jgi:hypothetical protein
VQAHPGLMAASIPWLSGADYKRLCTWFPYVSIVLVLTRDRSSGRVTIGKDGLPRLHYWPDAHDRGSMMKVSHCCVAMCNRTVSAGSPRVQQEILYMSALKFQA